MKPIILKGDEYTVKIKETSEESEGIAYIKGIKLIIPGSIEGDTVKIRIVEVFEDHALAEVITQKKQDYESEGSDFGSENDEFEELGIEEDEKEDSKLYGPNTDEEGLDE